MYGRNRAAQAGLAETGAFAIRRLCRPPPEQGMNAARGFRHTAGTRTDAAHKGEGYGSNRSREGPHTSSSGRWPAERGRRRAGASRLARSKGPPAHHDDDGRRQIANFARPRSRPHGLISAELRAIDRGIPLRTVTEPTRSGLGLAPVRAAAERKTPPTAGLKFWDERTQRVVEFVPPAPMRNLARGSAVSKKFFGGSPLPGRARTKPC